MSKIPNMDLYLIKKLLEKEKAKIVIVENGKPIMVISPIEDYLQEENPKKEESDPQVAQKELIFEGEKPQEEAILLPEEQREEKKALTIDDLPL